METILSNPHVARKLRNRSFSGTVNENRCLTIVDVYAEQLLSGSQGTLLQDVRALVEVPADAVKLIPDFLVPPSCELVRFTLIKNNSGTRSQRSIENAGRPICRNWIRVSYGVCRKNINQRIWQTKNNFTLSRKNGNIKDITYSLVKRI